MYTLIMIRYSKFYIPGVDDSLIFMCHSDPSGHTNMDS